MNGPGSAARGARDPRRARSATPDLAAAAVATVLLLTTQVGRVASDTKTYLFIDPGRFLRHAAFLWDPGVGLGTVTHQHIGYLWPAGPLIWLTTAVGLPTWAAQRLWLAGLLTASFVGVRWLLRQLRWERAGTTVAAALYALSPYVLAYAARLSILLLPFAALPWLVGLAVRSTTGTRAGRARDVAVFALIASSIGSVNASSMLFVLAAPGLWWLWAAVSDADVPVTRAFGAAASSAALTIGASAWWLSGLAIQGRHGIDVLRFTETYGMVASTTVSTDLLRGIGNWYAYGSDGAGPWVTPMRQLTERTWGVAASVALPIVGVASAAFVRWRHRSYFVLLVVTGVVVGVGAYPWSDPEPFGRLFRSATETQAGLALRNTPRVVPLIALGLAVLTGAGIATLARHRRRLAAIAGASLVLLAFLNEPGLWRRQLVERSLSRPEQLPATWRALAADLNRGDAALRVAEWPGADFSAYRWGDTVEPILAGLTTRDLVYRELVPYGTPAAASLVAAIDDALQDGRLTPEAVAPLARLVGLGEIVWRGDLDSERFGLAPAAATRALLAGAPGLGPWQTYGTGPDTIARSVVEQPEPALRIRDADAPLVVDGDASGLIALADAGLLDTSRAVALAAGVAPRSLDEQLAAPDAAVVVTDTNRRQARRWNSVVAVAGATELSEAQRRTAHLPAPADTTDNRLEVFAGSTDDDRSVAVHSGGAVVASSYGGATGYDPTARAVLGADGDRRTAWSIAADRRAEGEYLQVALDRPRDGGGVALTPLEIAPGQGRLRAVSLQRYLRGRPVGRPVAVTLNRTSSPLPPGGALTTTVELGSGRFDALRVTLALVDPGDAPVGLAEVRVGDAPPVTEWIRTPVTVARAVGRSSTPVPLTWVLDRRRSVRGDAETAIRRILPSPGAATYSVRGTARVIAPAAPGAAEAGGCTSGLVSVDGNAVPVRTEPPTPDGRVRFESCESVALGRGEARLETADAAGLRADLLVLRDDRLAPDRAAPVTGLRPPSVERTGRLSWRVTPASTDRDVWISSGQSLDDGWHLRTASGRDLGTPQLIDGYAAGWLVDATTLRSAGSLDLSWEPQRLVWWAMAVSAVAVLIAATLIVIGIRARRPGRVGDDGPAHAWAATARDVVPFATAAGWTAAAAGIAWWTMGAEVAATTALGVLVGLRIDRGPLALRTAAVAAMATAGAAMVALQRRDQPRLSSTWIDSFGPAHKPGLLAIALLAAVVLVDWRRSRPTGDAGPPDPRDTQPVGPPVGPSVATGDESPEATDLAHA